MRNGTGSQLADDGFAILMFHQDFIAGGKIDDDVGSRKRMMR